MSVSYQGEMFDISEQDLVQIKYELGEMSDQLYICGSNFESEEDYLLYLESKWNNPTPLTPEEEEEWLEYENSRMESDLLEGENEWL